MTSTRAIVVLSVAAALLAVSGVGAPIAAVVIGLFLLCAPGAVIGHRLGADDRFVTAAVVLAVSLAIDAVVAEALLYLHAFDGRLAVTLLAAWSIVSVVVADRRNRRLVPALDREVPALLVRVGHYPVNHGAVNAARTLGRAGVPVAAIVEDRWTPLALSRFTARAFVAPSDGDEPAAELVARLRTVAEQIGRPTVAVATDDEAAVLLAEHADELRPWLLLPRIDPTLTRRLASKRGLYELCVEHGVPTAATAFPQTMADVEEFASTAVFPVVVKNVDPFVRLAHQAVDATTIVHCAQDLLELARRWDAPSDAMLQEFIPHEDSEDWAYQTYCDAQSTPLVTFTCVKLRSWPPHAGVTAFARALPNPELERIASDFCRAIGYQGVASLDWRLDRRDGQYKLLDFNPRMGAQFSLFESESGVDIVRALHLDLSGRIVPPGASITGRALRVELLDLPARVVYGKTTAPAPKRALEGPRPHLAWSVADDPLPAVVMVVRSFAPALRRLARVVRFRRDDTEATGADAVAQTVTRT